MGRRERDLQGKRRAKIKRKLALLQGRDRCEECLQVCDPRILHLHHGDQVAKIYLGDENRKGYTPNFLEILEAEACTVLCPNCHMTYHLTSTYDDLIAAQEWYESTLATERSDNDTNTGETE